MSANSVASLASSTSTSPGAGESLPALVFCRDFVDDLFADSAAISLDRKSEFGSIARVLTLKH